MSQNHRHQIHPHSLKQITNQLPKPLDKKQITSHQNFISKQRENTKEIIRNLDNSSDHDQHDDFQKVDNANQITRTCEWFDQDLILANIFLYLRPMEVFHPNYCSSCACLMMVCKSWYRFISGSEFAKYYFEHSFCVSTPFINDVNGHEFEELDSMKFNFSQTIENDVEQWKKGIEEVKPLEALSCVKCFENEIGIKTNLLWKNNFHRKFLILTALMERRTHFPHTNSSDTVPLFEIIEKLLEPLTRSQIEKLNSILKKMKFSKLLTNSIKINSGRIVIFHDSGLPYILSSIHTIVCLGSTFLFNVIDNSFSTSSRVSIFLPPCSTSAERKTFEEVLCGLLPSILLFFKKRTVKRVPSPYMLFSQQKRMEVVSENPNISLSNQATIVANCWNRMSNDEKQVFFDKSNKMQEEYQNKIDNIQYIISGLD